MQTQLISKFIALACLLSGAFTACIRKEYHGGPANSVIKAYETISEQMQVANTDFSVYYLTKHEGTHSEGSSNTEYLFTIVEDYTDAAGVAQKRYWGLMMQISTYGNETFVDQTLWMPLDCNADTANAGANAYNLGNDLEFNNAVASGTIWGWTNPGTTQDAEYFCNSTNFQDCNILKENFTYFYEICADLFAPKP